MTLTFSLPWTTRALLTPEAQAAAVAKGTWSRGTDRADVGKIPAMMDQQQAGMTTTVSSPMALRAWRMDREAPQPGQAMWPLFRYSTVVTFQSMFFPSFFARQVSRAKRTA
jgi:hypothetical protein